MFERERLERICIDPAGGTVMPTALCRPREDLKDERFLIGQEPIDALAGTSLLKALAGECA